ncbi:MAG: hypothetical protein JRE64_15465 [Deltaproteobacteria bacterium]|nr:hypothetical protein [Deltaproteobacteria bacterium]
MNKNFNAKERSARCGIDISCDLKDGWYVLNLQGTNTQIGIQHGRMLAEEISAYIEEMKQYVFVCMGIDYDYARNNVKGEIDSTLSNEIRTEMTAISQGVNEMLATDYDVWDIALLNWLEGWSGYAFDSSAAYRHYSGVDRTSIVAPIKERRDHCSAFVATGRYTTDGKPVMFHNSFNVFETSGYSNVIATIKPEVGHKFTMQTQIGYVHSMADFYIVQVGENENDRVAITETTIGGFNVYNKLGIPEFDRIRRAVQHFTSINDKNDPTSFVNIMRKGESGDYANTWLLADYRDNSIWEFEEGLTFYNVNHKLATDDKPYFIGANYPKYPPIKNLECSNDGGDDIRRHQGARRVRITQLVEKHGESCKINLEVGREIIADHYDVYNNIETEGNSRTVCSHYNLDKREYMSDPSRPKPYQPRGAIDGMGIDGTLATRLQLNARWGSSCGKAWYADDFLKEHPQFDHLKPFLHDRPSYPWTKLPDVTED